MISKAKYTIHLFGGCVLFAEFHMLFTPKKARVLLRKAGSTLMINYTEISLRLIPAIAIILYAGYSRFPIAFEVLGWFMVLTSLVLYVIPRKVYHNFSMKITDRLLPINWQLLPPLSFLFGSFIIYNVI
jgi:hypothetical protein